MNRYFCLSVLFLTITITFSLPLPDYGESGYDYEQSSVAKIRCGQGFVSDGRGECVSMEEMQIVPINFDNVFDTLPSLLGV